MIYKKLSQNIEKAHLLLPIGESYDILEKNTVSVVRMLVFILLMGLLREA